MRKHALIALLAAFLTAAALLTAGLAASAQPFPETLTSDAGNTYAINNGGGGTGDGTAIIGWYPGSSNDGWSGYYGISGYCGSGLVTSTCPFPVGSGLNAEYQGSPIVEIYGFQIGKCATEETANPEYSDTVIVNDCGATGYLWVRHSYNGLDFYINVHLSSLNYTQFGSYDDPAFLTNTTPYGSPLVLMDRNENGGGPGAGWYQASS